LNGSDAQHCEDRSGVDPVKRCTALFVSPVSPDSETAAQRRSWFLRAGDTVETKRAAQRFSAIKMRSLNDPRQGSLSNRATALRCQPTHPSPAFLAGGRHPAQRLRAGDTVETKRAAHRFSAIRMRSQRSLPGLASNRSTVKPVSPPPRHTCMVQAEHPSPSARQFRLLPNGLAISELRRMFCSDEGACVRFGLNDLRSAARPTRSTGTDASVTFRPLILTPAQRVSRS
jgi:hypothetical protein